MKNTKKIVGIMLALVMVIGLAVTAFASGTGTVTVTNATKGNTYKIYKVFDANGNGTSIVYTLVSGKTTAPAGFTVDAATNTVTYTGTSTSAELTADDIAAIAEYVKNDTAVATVTATGETVEFTNLPNGYYYITTTTGTAVTVTSTNPDASVTDKNDGPVLDKVITAVTDGSVNADGKNALAEVGTTVSFKATAQVKNGAVGYVFHDTMSAGLAYNADSLSVKVDGTEVAAENYDKTTAEGETITLTFTDAWIKTQVGKTIEITYTATVTSDALSQTAATNTATLDYGHNGYTNTTTEKTTSVYNAKFTVTKTDNENQPLAGAGFVITKTEGDKTLYYAKNGNDVSWVENIADATELKTTDAENGNIITFTGLANGTYTLTEKTVPDGYTKAADSTFTVAENDYTAANLEQAVTVVNNAGSLLPSTGGIGTTIFYVVGSVLLIGAAVLLITKKRMSTAK